VTTPTQSVNGVGFANLYVELNVGPDAPVTAPVAAFLAAGAVDVGTHRYVVTFSSLVGQSGASPVSNSVVLVIPSTVQLTGVPLGPVGTTARNIYRTLASDPTGALWPVGSIADNTTTVFNDSVDDATIFNSGFASQPPPASCYWHLRLTAAGLLAGIIPIECDIWGGYKLTDLTPTGAYQYQGWGGTLCPLPLTGFTLILTLV
jgi:hypothetical protein